jgi:hypothetical protein
MIAFLFLTMCLFRRPQPSGWRPLFDSILMQLRGKNDLENSKIGELNYPWGLSTYPIPPTKPNTLQEEVPYRLSGSAIPHSIPELSASPHHRAIIPT